MQSLPTILITIKEMVGSISDFTEFAQQIWDKFEQHNSNAPDETPDVIAQVLQSMITDFPPRIALVGMTSAGKSTLVNALFGHSIAEAKRTPDTTRCVLEVSFSSGLTIYDTPGLAGDEKLGYENITRLFLDLPQDEDSTQFSTIPFKISSDEVVEILPEELTQLRIPDVILFLVDISRTLTKHEKNALKAFFLELKGKFQRQVIVAGTHLDELNKLSFQEKEGQISSYSKIFDNQLIPISSTSGEGLSELILNLFRIMPQKVNLAKLQESLVETKKLNRLLFVITHTSNLLAEIILLTGDQDKKIQANNLLLFALICKHYSVDEDTWLKCNGDAFEIGRRVKESGIRKYKISRNPENLWEIILTFFGQRFEREGILFHRLGLQGLKELLPNVYYLLHELAEIPLPRKSESEIERGICYVENRLIPLIERGKAKDIAYQIGYILEKLLISPPSLS